MAGLPGSKASSVTQGAAGGWLLVSVTEGLKPALLKVFINDLDDRMECTLQAHGRKGTAVEQVYLIF